MTGARYTLMSGAGNNFLLRVDRERRVPLPPMPETARRLCPRGTALGADGLILVQPGLRGHLRVWIWNADGSDAGICGNGLRCAARLGFMQVMAPRRMKLEVGETALEAEVLHDGRVRLELPWRGGTPGKYALEVGRRRVEGYRVDAGVPHFLVFVRDVERAPVHSLGPILRRHPDLGEEGANVDFLHRDPEGVIRLRTFERGVEAETLACGTAAAAAARLFHYLDGSPSEYRADILPRSGRPLVVRLDAVAQRIFLTGDARVVAEVEVHAEALA